MNEPTKKDFENKYSVSISSDAFEFLKKFLWEICCAKNTEQFYKDITQDNVNALVAHAEKYFN